MGTIHGWPIGLLTVLPVVAAAAAFAARPGAVTRWSTRIRGEGAAEELSTLHLRSRLATLGAVLVVLLLVAAATAVPHEKPTLQTGGAPSSSAKRSSGPSTAAAEGEGGDQTASTPSGPSAIGTSPASGGPLSTIARGLGPGASDQGVTAQSVHIATFRVNPMFYEEHGGTPDPQVERAVAAYAADINAHGGIGGRSWVPDVITIDDPTKEDQIQAACRTAFVDHHDFMGVNLGQLLGMPECAAGYGRPEADPGIGKIAATTVQGLNALGGRYWVAGMSADRMVELWARFLAQRYGTHTKIGILEYDSESLKATGKLLEAALTRAGFDGKYSVFVHDADPGKSALEAQVFISQFKSDGVQLVVPLTNAVAVDAGQRVADSMGWRPARGWTFSTIGDLDDSSSVDLYDDNQMNQSYGISLVTGVDEPQQAHCRSVYAAMWPGSTYSSFTSYACHMFYENAEALRRAGPVLTTATWEHGYAALGAYQGNAFGPETFSPAKRDGANDVRVWQVVCPNHVCQFSIVSSYRDHF